MDTPSLRSLLVACAGAASDDPYAHFLAGLVAYDAGLLGEAVDGVAASLRMDPARDCRTATFRRMVVEVYSRADMLARTGRVHDAASILAAVVRNLPEDQQARAGLNAALMSMLREPMMLHRGGQLQAAKDGYEAVLRLDPGNRNARHLLGLVLKHQGDALRSLELLAQVNMELPYSADFHLNLCNAVGFTIGKAEEFARLGDTARSEAHYRAVIDCLKGIDDPTHPLAQRGYHVDPDLPLPRQADIVYANVHGHILKEDFLSYLPEDAAIFECGAADGHDSVELASLFPKGMVYSVEASRREYAVLLEATRGCPNVRTFNFAISEAEGEATFYIYKDTIGRNTMLRPETSRQDEFEANTVPAMPLSAWAERNGITRLDLLWLDMEGAELMALQSAGDLIASVRAVYAEVSKTGMAFDGSCTYEEVARWLGERGFVVERELLPFNGEGNVLFVRRELSRKVAS
ncbi:FkbM family methyltransferase [Azospirillum sp.]|uniref:FkbM family methyltransferase n=1 Tax=Azospirillum sp. TaxID=34012 RepID=UPI003D755E02